MSEHGEDEVLAVVSPVAGRTLDPAMLLEFLRPRLPHFMQPRFIRQVESLPVTPTQKVLKHLLCAEGVTPATWDREVAGVRVSREALSAAPLREPGC